MSESFRLIVESGPERGRIVEIDDSVLTVGRQDGNDIVFDDPRVSRRHLRVEVSSNVAYLTDLGSSNGTFVNGQRLEGVRSLRDGDIVDLGESRLRVAVSAEDRPVGAHAPTPDRSLPNCPRLVLQNGEQQGLAFPLDRGVLTTGRHASNQIVLDDRQASRHHARFYLRDGMVSVSDLGSAHGTRVNGQAIHGTVTLRPGDLIQIGTSLLRLEAPEAALDRGANRGSPTVAHDLPRRPIPEAAAGGSADAPPHRQQDAPAMAWPPSGGYPPPQFGANVAAPPAAGARASPSRSRVVGIVAAVTLLALLCGTISMAAVLIRQRSTTASPTPGAFTGTVPAVVSPAGTRPAGNGGANPAPPGPGAGPTPTPSTSLPQDDLVRGGAKAGAERRPEQPLTGILAFQSQ